MSNQILEKLLSPITINDFFEQYWEKKVLHVPRNQIGYYQDYLSEEEVNACFKRGNLTYPNTQLRYKGGTTLAKKWTYEHKQKLFIDYDKIIPYLRNGHVILCNQFHEHSSALTTLIDGLKSFFKAHVINDYLIISRPSSASFNIHSDREHVIVIQIAGTKKWHFYDTHSPYLRGEYVKHSLNPQPSQTITMQPGDFLYLPYNLKCLCY